MNQAIYNHIASRTLKDSQSGCWLWQGSRNSRGYGRLTIQRQPYYVHRMMWESLHGSIPNHLFVLHTCDNPRCCNPDHLFLGTQTDNMQDCKAKGRVRHGTPDIRGERHPFARLTTAQVLEIRRLKSIGMKQREIASRFGLDEKLISLIVLRKRWKHI